MIAVYIISTIGTKLTTINQQRLHLNYRILIFGDIKTGIKYFLSLSSLFRCEIQCAYRKKIFMKNMVSIKIVTKNPWNSYLPVV